MSEQAPRPARDAAAIAEGRRLLAAATPGPYSLSAEHNAMGYDIDPLPQGLRYGMDRVEDARAVCWLLRHGEHLLAAAAERAALVEECERLRRAIALALDGPSDGEIGMETTLGRLNRIERQLRAVLAPAAEEGAGDGA